ncbi:axonemal dynein light intermediate polypeptide 1-like [Myripristis murdjan]|nr:axonemal dynein light intermediate polypeptide 1-like [Myripristis murdjan]
MNPPHDSLLKYDNPVLKTRSTDSSSPRQYIFSPQLPPVSGSAPPPPLPPDPRSAQAGNTMQQTQRILNAILPPREWMQNGQLWVQQVSSTPSTRDDVVRLAKQLNLKLQQRQARETGICPIRRELYSQCFDELIRQVTINCAERGLLLSQVCNESRRTMAAFQTLYESSVAYGFRKEMNAERSKADMEKRIAELQREKQDLEQQLSEQKAECEAVLTRENERRQMEKQRRAQEIEELQRHKQELKVQLEAVVLSN